MKPAWVKQSVWDALESKPLIPERLTYSTLPDGARYEVWHTPQSGAPYRVRYFLQPGDTYINEHPFSTEMGARKFFEDAVERKTTEYRKSQRRR